VTRTVVCDEGLEKCPRDQLVRVQLLLDGKKAQQVLCPKHAAPFVRLLEKMGGAGAGRRGKVYTPEEIAARRKAARKR
jgi:hypothetical protein